VNKLIILFFIAIAASLAGDCESRFEFKEGYSICPPAGWIAAPLTKGAAVSVSAPFALKSGDKFIAYMQMIVEPIAESFDTEVKNFAASARGYKLKEQIEISAEGIDGYKLVFTRNAAKREFTYYLFPIDEKNMPRLYLMYGEKRREKQVENSARTLRKTDRGAN
jgi:hypothetical protein